MREDLVGRRFYRLLVLRFHDTVNGGRHARWLCLCDCGEETIARGHKLKAGRAKGCGCVRRDILLARNTKHNLAQHPVYPVWKTMKARCTNASYRDYSGRGITVCERWALSFPAFLRDMGERPSKQHTVERINNDLGYCPENCRWATRKEQARNRRSNHFMTYMGETLTIAEWSERFQLPQALISARIARGWTVDRALNAPRIRGRANAPRDEKQRFVSPPKG